MQNVREDRDKYIGGSDIPILMGISPFRSRYSLLQEKAGIKENTFEGNMYTEYGNVMEEKIRDHINKHRRKKFVEDKIICGDLRYHADGYDGSRVLEIKTTSRIHTDVNKYKMYLVQLLFGMQMYAASEGMLVVYERPEQMSTQLEPKRLHVYRIRRTKYKGLLTEISICLEKFREDLAFLKEHPLATEEEIEGREDG